MTWFAVHALVALKKHAFSWPILVNENIFLVEAKSAEQATSEGSKMAMIEVSVEDGLSIDDEPATRTFVGIRKVVAISNPEHLDLDQDQPVSGTEITYSEYEVNSEEDLQKLANGSSVFLRYVD